MHISELVQVQDEGSIFLVYPQSESVRSWLKENTAGEWWGTALVVEHRYVNELLAGMFYDFSERN